MMMMTRKFRSYSSCPISPASIMMNCHACHGGGGCSSGSGDDDNKNLTSLKSTLQLAETTNTTTTARMKSHCYGCTRTKIRRYSSVYKIQLSNGHCFVTVLFLLLALSSTTVVTAANIGKYFTRSPQSIVAPPGDRVTFQCETNIPAEQVRWKLNERFLDPANESDIRVTWNSLSVKLSKNRERFVQQVGDYQCVAEFGAEALTSLPAQLTIAHMDPFKPGGNKTLVVTEDNTVAILCDAPYSNPLPFIQFYKDGQPLETEIIGNLMLTDSGVLLIHNATVRDSGSYVCTATNHITSDTFVSPTFTNLQVVRKGSSKRKAPEFLLKPKSKIIIPAEGNATLECIAIGNPPPTISFRRLRAPLPASNAAFKTNQGALHLINVGLAHEGEYVCEAYNNVGEAISTLSTIVLNIMPNITKEPKNLVVEEGGAAMLDCATEGLPKPRVYWVFNGHSVQPDGNIQITDRGLRITKVEKKHAGLFQCFAANPVGTVTSPAELKVMPKMITAMANDSSDVEEPVKNVTPPATRRHHHGQKHHHKKNRNAHKSHRGKKHKGRKNQLQDMIPPSKPIINRISEESVMVRWSASPNSGYPIQFFKIQYKELGRRKHQNFWRTIDDDIPPHIHSYEVTGLQLGSSYKFRIIAVYSNNDNREGDASEKVTMTREGLGRRPTFVPVITNAAPHNASTIRLQWKHMRAEGGGLDGYFIYYREATTASDYAKVTVLGSDTEVFYISHLKPGTAYDFKIQAFNKGGASNFSSIVASKTMGTATTERPDEGRKKQPELIIPEDEPPPSNDHLYLLFGCLFAGFWVFLFVACVLCYKCKQKRAEEEAKYPCEISTDIEAKTIPNGHAQMNGHTLNGFLPNISSHLAEKETSFVVDPHHNNNRPISPSQLELEELATFKSISLSLDRRGPNHHFPPPVQESRSPGTTLPRDRDTPPSRSGSLQRKKHHHNTIKSQNHTIQPSQSQSHLSNLKRGPYMSCSSEDLDGDMSDAKNSKVFPKEHYKHSRKHSRKRNSVGDG